MIKRHTLCLRKLEQGRLNQKSITHILMIFFGLLNAKSSYVRVRGFALCCAQARWDKSGKLQTALPAMLALLHGPKPIVVRQCLAALHEVVIYRPELSQAIRAELERIDVTKFKDSMAPLIKKDINELMKLIDG